MEVSFKKKLVHPFLVVLGLQEVILKKKITPLLFFVILCHVNLINTQLISVKIESLIIIFFSGITLIYIV